MNNELTKDDYNMIHFHNFIDLITEIILEDINRDKAIDINKNNKIA